MENEPNGIRKGQWPAIISLGAIVLGCDFALYALWKFAQTVFGH